MVKLTDVIILGIPVGMDGKTIVEGWGYDSERCPHTHIKQFPKLYCKLCMAADIDAALAGARQEERERWIKVIDGMAEFHSGPIQAALWGLAEMMEKNVEHIHVQTN